MSPAEGNLGNYPWPLALEGLSGSNWPTCAPANRFWFAHHVAAMMALAALPGPSCVPYEGTLDDIVDEAISFILRGIGMSNAAISSSGEPALSLSAAGFFRGGSFDSSGSSSNVS